LGNSANSSINGIQIENLLASGMIPQHQGNLPFDFGLTDGQHGERPQIERNLAGYLKERTDLPGISL
jgi:hypothetical protein